MKARELGTVFQEAEHEYAEDINILESYVLCAALTSRCRQQGKWVSALARCPSHLDASSSFLTGLGAHPWSSQESRLVKMWRQHRVS